MKRISCHNAILYNQLRIQEWKMKSFKVLILGNVAGVVSRSKEIRNMWGGTVKGSSKVI